MKGVELNNLYVFTETDKGSNSVFHITHKIMLTEFGPKTTKKINLLYSGGVYIFTKCFPFFSLPGPDYKLFW